MILDEKTSTHLKEKFSHELVDPVTVAIFVNSQETDDYRKQATAFLKDLVADLRPLSQKITYTIYDVADPAAKSYGITTAPTVLIDPDHYKLQYDGVPLGHEFGSFIDTLLMVSKKDPGFSQELVDEIKKIDTPVLLEVFVTPTCPYCPKAVLNAHRLAMVNPLIKAICVESTQCNERATAYGISGVPNTIINKNPATHVLGAVPEKKLIAEVIKIGSSTYNPSKAKEEALPKDPKSVVYLTDETFHEALKQYDLLVVDFWAEWCGPCRMLGPVIDDLAKEMAGKIVFGKLNVDDNPDTASEYDVMSIPTLIVFKKGKPIDTIIGALPKPLLKEKLSKY